MEQTHRALYKKAIEHFGEDEQIFQLMEELAELIKAANKWRRNRALVDKYPSYAADVAEEIADVEITLDELKIIVNISEAEISDIKYQKRKRLRERIDENRA